jgi:alanine dehydrogenase
MLIGIPKEIKNHEYRVSVSPSGVRELVRHGHQVMVESDAGKAIGFSNDKYHTAGALIVHHAEDIYGKAEMVVKVKEPQQSEFGLIRQGQILFCYLHLAAAHELAEELIKRDCIGVAYETVTAEDGTLPLLTPMSEIAGRVAVQAGAYYLEKSHGGRGVLLSGVPGVAPGKVTILGGGVVGVNAALIAQGMGAEVTILERNINRIRALEGRFAGRVKILYTTTEAIEAHVRESDLVIGAVLIPGGTAPVLVTESMVKSMRHGSVIVDVAIDQGGCIETMHATTHESPVFDVHGVIHYGVTNMPSAVAYTSSHALENATLPYILNLADKGLRSALKDDEHFRKGLNIHKGRITHEAVAKALGHAYTPARSVLGMD